MKTFGLFIILLSSACSTVFGGRVEGEYVYQFGNRVVCAPVSGWYDNVECLCTFTQEDPQISSKVFLLAEEEMCIQE